MLKLEQLYYLTQVAKYNSINKAAENLYITSAAVSTAIKQMEKECGYDILERTYRGVKLTEKGKEAVKLAEKILSLHDEVIGLGKQSKEVKEKYRLVVKRATLKLLQNKIVGPKARVLEHFKLMEIGNEIKDYNKYLQNDAIVLTIFESIDERERIESNDAVWVRYLYASKQYPVSSKNTKYIKENAKSISLEEFAKLPKVKIGTGIDILEGNIVLATEDSNIYAEAIQNDYGVGLITKFAPDVQAFDSCKLKVYEPFEKSEIYIAMLLNKNMDKSIADLLEKLIKG